MDNDDRTMNNISMKTFLCNKSDISYFYGNSKSKVEAINADMNKIKNDIDYSILIVLSDDMIPEVHEFDDIIYKEFVVRFPDFDGALFFSDGNVGERLNTLVVLGKKTYDYFGYIYHPSYISLWCDNEYTDVLKSMNKLPFINRVVIRHKWVGDHNPDELHRRNEKYYGKDEQNYKTRKANGFPK